MKTPLPNSNPITIATIAHAGQFRRDGVTPYIEHPRTVASHFEHGTDEWAAAWLHDVMEDTPYGYRDLKSAGINGDVLVALELLNHPQAQRYTDYIEQIKHAYELGHASGRIARSVKIADIATNLADDPSERQIKKYADALSILISTTTEDSP